MPTRELFSVLILLVMLSLFSIAQGQTHPTSALVPASGTVPASEAVPVSGSRPPGLPAAILRAAEVMPPTSRDIVRRVVQSPTLDAHPPSEEFIAQPQVYYWLLDHPDRVATAWQRLGVPCAKITATGPNQFAWTDELGGVLNWEPFYRGPDGRMWYARGQVKPSPLLPMIPVKAVAVLRCTPALPSVQAVPLRHQADLYILAESKIAGVTSKLLGGTVPKLAEQGTSQLLPFFGKMAQRLADNPHEVEELFGP